MLYVLFILGGKYFFWIRCFVGRFSGKEFARNSCKKCNSDAFLTLWMESRQINRFQLKDWSMVKIESGRISHKRGGYYLGVAWFQTQSMVFLSQSALFNNTVWNTFIISNQSITTQPSDITRKNILQCIIVTIDRTFGFHQLLTKQDKWRHATETWCTMQSNAIQYFLWKRIFSSTSRILGISRIFLLIIKFW